MHPQPPPGRGANTPAADDNTASEALEKNRSRGGSRWVRPLLLWGLPLLVVAIGVYWYGSGGRYASTDNAYLKQDRIDVAPQIAGDVREVRVLENAAVKPGDVVLVLDDTLLQVARMHAEAELAAARMEVDSLRAAYREKAGEVEVARLASHYAISELGRQQELANRKLVPAATLENATRSRDLAVGSIAVLELQLDQAKARLGGTADRPVDEHPTVRTAAAVLEKTKVDLEHTIVRAPRAGIVSHLPQTGDRVEAGRAAFAIVTDGGVYVEANFKETDLEWVRPGEAATIEIDTYPGREWTGKVAILARSTQINTSYLGEHFSVYDVQRWQATRVVPGANLGTAQLMGEIERQAAAIAYATDFHLMAIATIIVLPLMWLLKPPRDKSTSPVEVGEMG